MFRRILFAVGCIALLLAPSSSVFAAGQCFCDVSVATMTSEVLNRGITVRRLCESQPTCRWEEAAAGPTPAPIPVSGSLTPALQFDQRCFTESTCATQRITLGLDETEGFAQPPRSVAACSGFQLINPDEEVGFCTAGSEIKTNIGFSGRRTFEGVADFIAYMFSISFTIATAIAVVIVIASGIQWTVSAGNSSMIGDAKKRIGGAFMGLALLAFSYIILNTINPALTSLRPIEIYMINPIQVAPEFCSDLDQDPVLYLASVLGEANKTPLATAITGETFTSTTAKCGDQFYIQNAGDQTCRGSYCEVYNESCVPFDIQGGFTKRIVLDTYSCQDIRNQFEIEPALLTQNVLEAIGVNFGGLGFRILADDVWVYDPKIIPVCKKSNGNIVIPRESGPRSRVEPRDLPSGRHCFNNVVTGQSVCSEAETTIIGEEPSSAQKVTIFTNKSLTTYARSICTDTVGSHDNNTVGYLLKIKVDFTGLSTNKTLILMKNGNMLGDMDAIPTDAALTGNTGGEDFIRENVITNDEKQFYIINDTIIESLSDDIGH